MDSALLHNPEELLRRRLSSFVARAYPWHRAISTILQRARVRGWTIFVFGGTLRDLVALSPAVAPRDLDLVVSGASSEALQAAFADELLRVTRFGGLHLHLHKLPVDIWPLESTWAFRERLVPGGDFADLPRTTFLNVEAVAAELDTTPGRRRRIYHQAFFSGIQERMLEINLEHNPYPGLCVVRSLITARRLQFSLGPRLARFIAHHGTLLPMEELEAIQLSHYGRIRLDRDHLQRLVGVVRKEAGATKKPRPVSLPRAHRLEWHSWWAPSP